MANVRRITALNLCDDPTLAARADAALARLDGRTVAPSEPIAGNEPLELVIADAPISGCLPPALAEQVAHGAVGLIAFGWPGPADVALAADASERELSLAEQLLSEIVRLRRRWQALEQQRISLATEARTDPLTGLANRRAWDTEAILRVSRWPQEQGGCLAILDLDTFKALNDASGHLAGDEALRSAAHALARHVRRDDFVARLGGDEFGLLLDGLSTSEAAAPVVERIRRTLTIDAPLLDGQPLTASAGFAVLAPGAQAASVEQLFASADSALRDAKLAGRNHSRPAVT
jgi:diguanylate cyclase (GGDEF)-like protein